MLELGALADEDNPSLEATGWLEERISLLLVGGFDDETIVLDELTTSLEDEGLISLDVVDIDGLGLEEMISELLLTMLELGVLLLMTSLEEAKVLEALTTLDELLTEEL
jgi:hypothetical protein